MGRNSRSNGYIADQVERFWSYVDRSGGEDACWPWKLSGVRGYGIFWFEIDGQLKSRLAHKISHFLTTGRWVPSDQDVMHSCDNRPCCNPRHLSEGTRQENVDDMIRKGRAQDYTKRSRAA